MRDNVSEQVACDTRIIYAGSVTESNSETLIKLPDVDGFLVGSTSTKPVFRSIFECVSSQASK